MGYLDSIRSKLAAKVFTTNLASTAVVETKAAEIMDKWGDPAITYGTPTTVYCVPYDYVKKTLNYQPFGDLQQGQTDMVFPYNVTISSGSRITYDGSYYTVLQISPINIQNGIAAIIVRLQRNL